MDGDVLTWWLTSGLHTINLLRTTVHNKNIRLRRLNQLPVIVVWNDRSPVRQARVRVFAVIWQKPWILTCANKRLHSHQYAEPGPFLNGK